MPQQFESYIDRVEREQLEEARLRLGDRINYDQGRAQEILRLKGATGLPEQLIDADFDNISEQVRLREFDSDKYKDTAPAWREFASENPMNLAVLKRDEENLTKFERAYREMDSTSLLEKVGSYGREYIGASKYAPTGNWMKPTANAIKSSWAANEMLEIGAAAQRSGGYTPEQEERLSELRKYQASHDFGAEWSKPIVWLAKESANMTVSAMDRMERGTQFGVTGAAVGGAYGAAGGTFILPGGGTAVGGTAGAIGGFGIGFSVGALSGGYEVGARLGRGEAYNEYRELGFNHEDAAWAAEIAGNVSGLIETTVGSVMFDKLPGVRQLTQRGGDQIVKQLLGQETFRQVAGRAAFDYGAGVTGEIVTEVLQESSLIVMGEVLKGRTPGIAEELTGDEITSRIGDIALHTLKSTFLIAGAGPGQRLVMDGRRARNAENFGTVLKEMADGAQKTEMRKDLPDQWRAFVERVTENGEQKTIGMPVEEFTEYWQSKGVSAEEAAKELGIENLEEATLMGVDIQIPMQQFADKIAGNTQTFNQMLPNLRPHDDAMTLREAEQYFKDREEIMGILEAGSARVRETEEDLDIEAIVQDVQTQLVAAGHDEESAGKLAQIMRGIGIMAQREGMDPKPLYEQIFGGVKRSTDGEQTQGEDVDAQIDPLLNKLRDGDFPTQREMFGPSLMDFLAAEGGIDLGDPELVAMDFETGAQDLGFSKAKMRRWKEEGKDVAHIAEIAAEAGYLPANDEKLLLDGLREELGGNQVYGNREAGDTDQRDLAANLETLQGIINEANIDLENMTNAEVRQALNERKTLAQIDTKELQDLTALVLQQVSISERVSVDQMYEPFNSEGAVDPTLARAAALLPAVDETQDFGDAKISDRVRIQETGKRGTMKVRAQDKFRRAVKRKNVIKRLLDCVSA